MDKGEARFARRTGKDRVSSEHEAPSIVFPEQIDIQEEAVRHVRLIWPCPQDECEGQMRATGEYFAINPPSYCHRCDVCGLTLTLRGGQKYPMIQYREAPSD